MSSKFFGNSLNKSASEKKGINKKCLIKVTSLKLRVLEKLGEAINLKL